MTASSLKITDHSSAIHAKSWDRDDLHKSNFCNQGPNTRAAEPPSQTEHLSQPTEVGLDDLGPAKEPLDGYKLHDTGQGLVANPRFRLQVAVQCRDGVSLELHGRRLVDVLVLCQGAGRDVERRLGEQGRLNTPGDVVSDEGVVGVGDALEGALEVVKEFGDCCFALSVTDRFFPNFTRRGLIDKG